MTFIGKKLWLDLINDLETMIFVQPLIDSAENSNINRLRKQWFIKKLKNTIEMGKALENITSYNASSKTEIPTIIFKDLEYEIFYYLSFDIKNRAIEILEFDLVANIQNSYSSKNILSAFDTDLMIANLVNTEPTHRYRLTGFFEEKKELIN